MTLHRRHRRAVGRLLRAPAHPRYQLRHGVASALAKLDRWKAKKGWDIPWSSSLGTDFNYDFGVTIDESVAPGEYNFRPEPRPRPWGRTSSLQTSFSRC